jgi:hypothetical protein
LHFSFSVSGEGRKSDQQFIYYSSNSTLMIPVIDVYDIGSRLKPTASYEIIATVKSLPVWIPPLVVVLLVLTFRSQVCPASP